ncbi:hypothetical protein I4U23_016996 [Adineta vaga]|nr:hypothetical protein I4U23_016996 [Adineta vaga]
MILGQGQRLLEVFERSNPNAIDDETLDLGTQSMFNCNRYMIDKSRDIRQQNDQLNLMNINTI